ncbi:MAG TPA: hypothetical protein VER14_05025 [Phototrophicaceae bacterium]|nr:hypothetical protein [Phototrophicaceae bacterium]
MLKAFIGTGSMVPMACYSTVQHLEYRHLDYVICEPFTRYITLLCVRYNKSGQIIHLILKKIRECNACKDAEVLQQLIGFEKKEDNSITINHLET